jgi:hypothetical protein
MSEVSTIGLDLAKNVFQAHEAGNAGAVMFRKKLRRNQLIPFLATQSPCIVPAEACASELLGARDRQARPYSQAHREAIREAAKERYGRCRSDLRGSFRLFDPTRSCNGMARHMLAVRRHGQPDPHCKSS